MKSLLSFVALCSVCFAQLMTLGAGAGGTTGVSAISFTDVQHPFGTPATCTNCSVTLTQSIGTGNILVAMANGYTNAVTITGITGQSGVVNCPSGFNKGSSSTGHSTIAYTLSTTAQASPVNVTFSGATGSTTNIQLQEWSVTNGPAALDICGSLSNPSNTTTQAGVTPTYSGAGTNEATMQYCSTAAACNSVANYTGLNVNTNGQGWATQINSKTTTAPNWTLSSAGIMEAGIIAFGKSTTACLPNVVADFGGGTNGSQITAALMNGATHPTHDISPWGRTGTTGFIWDTGSKLALNSAIKFCDDGSTYSDSSTMGGKFDISTTDTISYGFTAFPDNISYGFYLKTTVPNNDNNHQYDVARAVLDVNGEAATLNIIGNGTGLKARLEVSGGSTIQSDCGNFGDFVSGTQYWISMEVVRNTRYTLKVYDATAPSALSVICTTSGAVTQSSHGIASLGFGHVGAVTSGSSLFFQYSQIKIDRSATYPLLN